MFAFHWNGSVVGSADANMTVDNALSGAMASYKSPVGYHPCLPIQQIVINFSGRQYQLNVQSLMNLGILEVSTGEDDFYYSDP
jgi:hypothetical protein